MSVPRQPQSRQRTPKFHAGCNPNKNGRAGQKRLKKSRRREKGRGLSYLLRCKLSLVGFVDEAFIQERHQRIRVDMGRKVKMSVRLVDPPLLLQLGGRLSIICSGQSHLVHLSVRGGKKPSAGHRTYLTRGDICSCESEAGGQRSAARRRRLGRVCRGGEKTTNLHTRKLTLSVSSSSFIVGTCRLGMGGDERCSRFMYTGDTNDETRCWASSRQAVGNRGRLGLGSAMKDEKEPSKAPGRDLEVAAFGPRASAGLPKCGMGSHQGSLPLVWARHAKSRTLARTLNPSELQPQHHSQVPATSCSALSQHGRCCRTGV